MITGKEISQEIAKIKPNKIAVAYLGADWKKYLPEFDVIESIVISPTLGTNPRAVMELVKAIGWDRIYFLNELHAKIYIAQEAAVVGSANLSSNGLCGEVLLECCAILKSPEDVKAVSTIFDDIVRKATAQYPNLHSKESRLAWLTNLQNAAISNELISTGSSDAPKIENYKVSSDQDFYVCWWMPCDGWGYSDKAEAFSSVIEYELCFRPEDKLEKNKFILVWKKTTSDRVDGRSEIFWLYIHDILDEGAIDENYGYTKLAFQRTDKKVPPAPFKITKQVKKSFSKIISSKELNDCLVQNEESFRLNKTFEALPRLVAALRAEE